MRGLKGIISGRGMLVERWQYSFKNCMGKTCKRKQSRSPHDTLLMDSLVSRQFLYLWPASQNLVFLIVHTDSVFLISCKLQAPVTDTFFASRRCVSTYESSHCIPCWSPNQFLTLPGSATLSFKRICKFNCQLFNFLLIIVNFTESNIHCPQLAD